MNQTTPSVRTAQVPINSSGNIEPGTNKPSNPNGVVLYRGPSLINGQPVVCIATGLVRKSRNRTTGPFVQTWILPDGDDSPLAALRSGGDAAVCGDCPHRPLILPNGRRVLGSCYLNVGQAPLAIWQADRRGNYPRFGPRQHLDLFRGRWIRLGSYGDPAAVPLAVWDQVCAVVAGWTGSTHQFRTCDRGYTRYCMASCETIADRRFALRLGYRTFRVRLPEQPLDAGEFVCPASDEGGNRLTCAECRACSGAKGTDNASPCIIVHESPTVPYKVRLYRTFLDRLPPERSGWINLL
jgi:hypothetical protein